MNRAKKAVRGFMLWFKLTAAMLGITAIAQKTANNEINAFAGTFAVVLLYAAAAAYFWHIAARAERRVK